MLKEAVVTPPLVLTLIGGLGLPSITNWTWPVGVPPPGDTMLIVAVKFTFWPTTDGLGVELTAVLLLALFTIWVSVPVLVVKLVSPE